MAFRDVLTQFLSLGAQPQPVQLPAPKAWNSHVDLIQKRQEEVQTRAIDSYTSYPGLEQQLLAVQGLTDRPWRYPGINEALGVPAIFRAVALIANTTGSLAMEAWRDGRRLPYSDIPSVVRRPDPFRIPRDFFRDTAFDLAARGEFWWWVAKRDIDGLAMSLIRVPPWEVTIQPTDDRLRPIIRWFNREMPSEDMRHGTFLPDDTGYRGVGPLQMCGAAISVAVEAQEWAANFYAEGGYPSIIIKSATELGGNPGADAATEADQLRSQWMARDHNTPRVIDPGIESVDRLEVNEQGAQMLDSRNANNGDAARMFGIPGELLEYSAQGSSLTYQNVAEVFTRFVKTPLAPDYLEPIEQHMTDLLSRSTAARFNVKGFLRADVKTRWEVYEIATRVVGPEEAASMAREQEGLEPGDIEFAPVPFSPPSAIPTKLPIQLRAAEPVRCDGKRMLKGLIKPCGKLLAEQRPYSGTCPRCGKFVEVKAEPVSVVAAAIPQPPQSLVLRSVAQPVLEVVPQAPPEPTAREILEANREILVANQEILVAMPAMIAAALPRSETPVVNFHERAINVEAPPPSQVHIDNHVAAPDMSMMPAAQMTIAEGAIQTTVNVPPAQPEPPTSSRVVKDADGNITITRSVA